MIKGSYFDGLVPCINDAVLSIVTNFIIKSVRSVTWTELMSRDSY